MSDGLRPDAPLWTMRELADYLRVTTKTVQRWIKTGAPVVNVGGPVRPDWRFDVAEVRAWLRRRDATRSGLVAQAEPCATNVEAPRIPA